MVDLLLNEGCPVDQRDRHGYTALHLAAENDNVAVAELLLGWKPRGAQIQQIETRNKDECGPLAWAAYKGSFQLVTLLIRSGADIKRRGANGKTPFLAAAAYSFSISKTYWLPILLRSVTAQRKMDILRFLVEAGADPHDVDNAGKGAQKLLFGRRWYFHDTESDLRNRQLVARYLEGLSLL